MTREQVIDMFAMKYDGHTLKEIGDKYGVTRECVRKLIDTSKYQATDKFDDIIYPKIREWIIEHHINFGQFGKSIYLSKSKSSLGGLAHQLLNGKSKLTVDKIKAIHEFTGLSYEDIMQTK